MEKQSFLIGLATGIVGTLLGVLIITFGPLLVNSDEVVVTPKVTEKVELEHLSEKEVASLAYAEGISFNGDNGFSMTVDPIIVVKALKSMQDEIKADKEAIYEAEKQLEIRAAELKEEKITIDIYKMSREADIERLLKARETALVKREVKMDVLEEVQFNAEN